ncbi:inositol monophosphatase [Halomonas denitrificans]|uniref:inositol monophosphatase family protein n=1 Tax=Halomonas TaxID=2745 RepID=UPI001A8E8F3B|nr:MULTISPECIES: inositol monophosphatase family protein [Halomonas]MED5293986.1 inositol monophosphatase family protein [Pseudomonadota bacterium]MBN8411186.1 inositol monophosphatase [Halomonas litopenaei]MBY5925808.1 inositol monophosphatase [Halomonas sp. DP4Y7-2]MBY5927540.1 inositol monophosphatase [Halomonas sp. DP8Y7-3]MBY5969628.1 inositol monophosphatase [Halomonas denitrificans]
MNLEERLAVTIEIAKAAGQMIADARDNDDLQHHYKDGQELVTDTDVAVDTMISQRLESAFPGEERLSEELSPDKDALEQGGDLWVVDPIDGTVNFAHGLCHVAVSIAYVKDGVTQLGVVHAPFLGETYTAVRGKGAWCNDQPIKASQAKSLDASLVGTGFPYRRDSRPPLMRRLGAVLHRCRDIRRNGSAALDLCDVARGRLDAYYETVSPWDFAAGWLIAAEAGATTGHLYPCPGGLPEDLYGENLLVSAPSIHAELADLLRRADAGELREDSADQA